MKRRAPTPGGLSPEDLRIVAKLEARPLLRGQALATALGMGPSLAWRRVRELRRRGVLNSATSITLRRDICECVTLLKVDWVDPGGLELLDSWIADDQAILTAARVTGPYDYRLRSRHLDIRSASDWSRSLLSRPKVAEVLTQFCTTLFDRPNFAAAILGTE